MHACIARACAASCASPELTKSIELLRQTLNAFLRAGAEANATFFLWGLAQGLRVQGNTAAATDVIIEALHRADASGELYFKSELLTLAAELDADEDRACGLLRDALQLALKQHARPLALRAALELARRKGWDVPADAHTAPHQIASLRPLPEEDVTSTFLLSRACAALGVSIDTILT